MGTIGPPKPVKLFVGMLSADRELMRRARKLLCERFGEVDLESPYWPFEHTEYYRDELGEAVERHFISFAPLIQPDQIAHIKCLTNDTEVLLGANIDPRPPRRLANLDPGYMSLSKLVLATTKDYSHRIYLQEGIFAEVTLYYHDGEWRPRPWTYPDYAGGRYQQFFLQMRERLKAQYADACPNRLGAQNRE